MDMLEARIADFVSEVAAIRCDMCAVGHESYLFGDADLTDVDYERVAPILSEIDHLKAEIIAYLRSIRRFIDLDDA
ncbi:hypothetical protein [Neorhizobium sp. DAR64872/K0K18]|uniref:hypothetical protein n=1 Tax=Neorhizobium sp. DAR64872/K0K18 TaxID=3421958 RepID=UPI003D2AB9D3